MLKRAFAEFLTVPTLIIFGFLLLAASTYILDRTEVSWLEPLRYVLRTRVFVNAEATSDLLGTIAGGIITVTSITISLLLLAVQQSASSLTSEVFDQFLRRRHNQIYFGFFVGLALYALITLATVDDPFNPVFGASGVFLLTIIALYLLVLLLYTTINQMRPVEIIETIHDHTLRARERQLSLIQRTRRAPVYDCEVCLSVKATRHGYVTGINIEAIEAATKKAQAQVEIVLHISIGSYLAFQDAFADVKAGTMEEAKEIAETVRDAIQIERQRDVDVDPAYGIEQLATIAWTSISTSKSNPAPGLLTIRSLRDLLAHWCIEELEDSDKETLPIVYTDNTFAELMNAFESLAIVSTESMQHQNFTEVVRTFVNMFDRLTAIQQRRAEDLILRIISALGDHVLTAELNATISQLISTLEAAGRTDTALAVETAREKLAQSVGKLNSRSTRVPTNA